MKLAGFMFACLAFMPAFAAEPAPNTVIVSPRLVTSGQPNRAFLETLKSQGFEVVVYLAPPTVHDAIAEEPKIVAKQGLVYVNIPIAWSAPTAADLDAVRRVLSAYGDRKVYVHCQANYRASSMIFLYRVIHLKDSPDKAWDAVRGAWEPNKTWRAFIVAMLKANAVDYEPL